MPPVLRLAMLVMAFGQPLAAAPTVVTDIAPIQSLAAQVMAGIGTPVLLADHGADPHDMQLRPSQRRALQSADLLFWIGPEMTPWLIDLAAAGPARSVPLSHSAGVILRAPMFGPGEDPHIWLDPVNGKAILARIASELAALDPANAPRYAANAEAAQTALDALTVSIAAQLAPGTGTPLIVPHDAFAHFAARFPVTILGAVARGDAAQPGAAALADLRARAAAEGAACVFAEPHEPDGQPAALAADLGLPLGLLDPEATALDPGPGLYAGLLRGLADAIAGCRTAP